MEILSGLILAASMGLAVVIGLRMVRMGRARKAGAELWLGLFFLLFAFLSVGLTAVLYAGWADPAYALPEGVWPALHAVYIAVSSLGLGALHVFVWRTFRRDAVWARSFVLFIGAVIVGSAVALAATDGFERQIIGGPAYWVSHTARYGAFTWMAIESLRYWVLQRRRLRLGLADPLVANRFLLLGVWGVVSTLNAASDVWARMWYVHIAGTSTVWIPEIGQHVVFPMIAGSSALLCVTGALLLLAFFPSEAYRRWITARAAAAQPASG